MAKIVKIKDLVVDEFAVKNYVGGTRKATPTRGAKGIPAPLWSG
jgi:hypothetical protein